MLRSAQLTAFFTKLRSSKASRSTSSKQLHEGLVASRLVVHGEAGHEGEAGALDELRGPARPGDRLRPGEGRAVEEIGRHLVADVPRIEVGRPALHLSHVDLVWFVDEGGQQASFVVAGAPQLEGELVIVAEVLCQASQHGDRHAVSVVDLDAVARHAGAIGLAAKRRDLGEDRSRTAALGGGGRRTAALGGGRRTAARRPRRAGSWLPGHAPRLMGRSGRGRRGSSAATP